jgi:hypothetical protein
MNNKIISVVVIGVVALVAGLGIVISQDNDNTTENNNSSTEQTTVDQANGPSFSAVNSFDQSFVATITGTSAGESFSGTLEVDGNGNGRFTSVQAESGLSSEFYFNPNEFITCNEGTCFSTPNTGTSPFDINTYTFDDSEFETFKNNSSYEGEQDCPAGTCDVWLVNDAAEGLETKIYINKSDQRISQVIGTQDGETTSIVYEFKDVTINFPENVQQSPQFNL